MTAPTRATAPESGKRLWYRRATTLAFCFFLLKGLLWVASLVAAWLIAF